MGQRQGIGTDYANRRETHANGQRTIVRIAEQNVLFDFIAGYDFARIAVDLGEHPNALAVFQAAGRVNRRFARFQERLEPFEGVGVLQRNVTRADNAEDGFVRRSNGRLVAYGAAVAGQLQIFEHHFPV